MSCHLNFSRSYTLATKCERLDHKCNSAVFPTIRCKYKTQPGHGGWQDWTTSQVDHILMTAIKHSANCNVF